MTERILAAQEVAKIAHKGQKRKYTGSNYVTHCFAVANMVEAYYPNEEDAIIAATLHDTVEDTDTTIEEIKDMFGEYVARLVYYLTDVSCPADGNRKTRKALDRAHNVKGPFMARIIKLADMIDNTFSITAHDPDFAMVYMKEKRMLLALMERHDPAITATPLWNIANEQIAQWEQSLLDEHLRKKGNA